MSLSVPNRPVIIRCVDGRRFATTAVSASDLLLHPFSLKFLIPSALVFATLDRGSTFSLTEAGIVALLILAIALGGAILVVRLLSGCTIAEVYTPALVLPICAAASAGVWLAITALQEMPRFSGADWLRMTLRDLFVIACMDLAFSQFVAPLHPLLHPVGPSSDADTAPASGLEETLPDADQQDCPVEHAEMVAIGTETFPVTELLSIRAEDHYLRIVTTGGRTMLRGRLSDATALIDMRRGMQVNRSAWVAFDAILGVKDEGRGYVTLALADGTTERLAQSRRIAFQSAMALRNRT